jgi:hypothetical protein
VVVKRKLLFSYLNHIIIVCCGLPLGFTVDSCSARGHLRNSMTGGERVADDDVRRIDCMEAPFICPQAIVASSVDQEFHSHQGTALDPRL